MPLAKANPTQPGFISQATQVQAASRWFGGNRVRWRFGFLEKMGGWQRLWPTAFAGMIRRMHAWLDLNGFPYLFVASDVALEVLVQQAGAFQAYPINRSPNIIGGQDPVSGGGPSFSVTSGSTDVTVTTPSAHGMTLGQFFTVQCHLSIGGRIIPVGTTFFVSSVPNSTTFHFAMTQAALYTEAGAVLGGPLLTNNIVNGMTVTWRNHGLIPGNTFTFVQRTQLQVGIVSNSDTVNFTAPAGTVVTIASVPTVDTFTFLMGSLGTGDGAGGTNHQVYEGWTIQRQVVPPAPALAGSTMLGPGMGNPQTFTWFLDNLGKNGLALRSDGPLEVWSPPYPISGPLSTTIVGAGPPATAPQHSLGMFVAMPQAQVIVFDTETTLGSNVLDPLLVRWSDAGTYDVWTATVSNMAGQYRLGRGSKIVAGIQAPQTALLLTDVDLWSMSFIGPPLVYGFTIMGKGCGAIAPHAIVALGKTTYWLSTKNVWSFGDGGLQIIPCSVWDFIFENLDTINLNKAHGAANSTTGEIAFYFPPKDATDLPNMLARSQQFSPDAWNRTNTTILASVPNAPDGTNSASELQEVGTSLTNYNLYQSVQKAGEPRIYTFSVYIHESSTRQVALQADAGGSANAYVIFNPSGLAVVATQAIAPFQLIGYGRRNDTFATGSTGNGWDRYFVTFQTDSTASLRLLLMLASGSAFNYVGSGQFAYIWGAQLNAGALTDYVATGAALPQNEPTRYIKLNTLENAWDSGTLQRSAWIDNSIWGTPLGADANYLVQQHERSFDDDGQPMTGVYAESGYTEIATGDQMMSVHQVHPDFKWFGRNGEVQLRFKAKNYPGDEGIVNTYGPFSITPTTRFFDPRLRARYVAMRYDWAPIAGFSARVGAVTFKIKPTGRRP